MFVSHGSVVLDSKFFEESGDASMFVADIGGSNGGVDEAFTARHAVKEKFTLVEAFDVIRMYESA